MKRILQMVIGGIGFGFYFFPIILGGIFNIGTAAGLLIFGGLFLWGAFRPRILNVLPEMRRKKPLKILTNVFCVLFAAGLFTAAVLSGLMLKACFNEPAPDATVIVLGCAVKDGRPSKMMRTRINAAAEYLKKNPQAKCIVSGGKGEDEAFSEAECMYNELINAGIADDRLFTEDRSTSTRENLLFSREMIEENGLSTELAVVTNEFHEYRAYLIARGLGLESGSVPADTPPGLLPVYWTRELAGILYEWIF